MIDLIIKYSILIASFLLSLVISTLLIRYGIPYLHKHGGRKDEKKQPLTPRPVWYHDSGFWIGFFEIIVIFSFILYREFSALAIIFGAKGYLRQENIKQDPLYYLLGPFINYGVALIFIQAAKEILQLI